MYKTFFLITICFLMTTASLADIHNPKPYTDDLILPMPDGASMVFRPVFIGVGNKLFAVKEFKLGDRTGGGFKEYPTNVVIGGSFIAKNPNGQPDWVYYIGKYEVSEAQYYSIMAAGTKKDSDLPASNISWFDVQDFINKYNLWLFTNAKDKIPVYEESVGYLRLPTETEWEFAARGGGNVEATHFDKKHPYPSPLSKYEWFDGPSSSHGKIKKIGILEPNDLKIHDMLGNVSEMTGSFYQVEYYQGRTGGFVSRGGHCFTSEDKIRSSLREEIPFYKPGSGSISPTKQPTLGFRLVIASQIYASRDSSSKLAAAWEEYVKSSRVVPAPATPTTSSARTDVQLADAMKSLEVLTSELNKMSATSQTVADQLGILKASFKNVESTVKKAEHDSAFAWIKIASETAYLICSREMKEIPAKRKALEIATEMNNTKIIDSLKEQITAKEKNIQDGLNSYGFSFMQIEKIHENSVKAGFDKYLEFLMRRGAVAEQIKVSDMVKKHYQEYFQDRRLNVEKWKADFEKF